MRAVELPAAYEQDANPTGITEAIDNYQNAQVLTPPGQAERAAYLGNLAFAAVARYERQGDVDDLALAIQYLQEWRDLYPIQHPSLPEALAGTIMLRYRREGNMDDLTLVIQYRQEALNHSPPGHPDRSASLTNLAAAIQTRCEREGGLDNLVRAIQYYQEALDLRPTGHSERPASLNNLATAILARYQTEGNLDDHTRAIQYHEEALDLCPPGHPHRSASLNKLAGAIQIRYEREGNLDDLTRAIQYYEEALGFHPPEDPERSAALSNLAGAILSRYEREGNLGDLTRTVQYHQEALDLYPLGHPDRSAALNNLANAIQTRYHREGNLDDLTRAIQYHQEALDLRPPGHPDRSASLNNLALALRTRHKRERNVDDLTCAIQYHQEAVDLYTPGHPHRSAFLHKLAEALYDHYSLTENVAPVSLNLRADTVEPLEHPERPSSECVLRDSSRRRIISLLREASQSTSCSPRDCLRAALAWVTISKDLAPESTLEAYTAALHKLDLALAIGQSLSRRYNRLLSDETKDLGVNAATWALQHGNLERAVELLEQGRSLLFAQIGRYRVELDDLRAVNRELADRFARLSRLLDASIVSDKKLEGASSAIKDPYERYRKLSTEWTQAVDEIRDVQGFGTFLKPIPYGQLRQAAAEGPVIMLVLHQKGTVALIICNDAPIHRVDLPHATSKRLTKLSNKFTRALNHKDYNDAQRERKCADKLASLWEKLVGPIARALQQDLRIPLRSRVWWCPTSAACFLPLHAAGLYAKAKAGENFPDKYISSYTTTFQALLRARRSNSTAPKRLLVISQPQTPDEPPLPYARDEAVKIANIMSSNSAEPPIAITSLASEAGTCEAVQREMASHPWIHFICHGVQAAKQPLDSYLSLHDGHLTLRKIIEQNLPNADFAFLAACHSAAGDKDLANEALHLAAAMQFAGFRSVVGTLWKMRDVDGPPLAEAFYKDMVKRGDHRRAAVALSKAINQLRRNRVPIHCWMRFIHIGT